MVCLTIMRILGRLGVHLTRLAHLWGAGHAYLSTSCLHGQHGYCESARGSTMLSGTEETWHKKPSTCKFCSAECVCSCHLKGRHGRRR